MAAKAGLSRVGYRNIETGTAEPRVETLQRLAAALGVRLNKLLVEVELLKHVRFRARKTLASREAVLADVSTWLRNFNELERLIGERQRFRLDPLRRALLHRHEGADRARLAAAKAREVLKVGRRELIRDICGLLETRAGVKLYTPAVASEGFFGLCVAAEDGGPAIAVNTWQRISVERWIFSAAHELGHLLLHAGAFDVTKKDESEAEEREADTFAGNFLMPDDLFVREWEDARGLGLVDRVFKVKRIFRVSWKTVLHRVIEREGNQKLWPIFYASYKRLTGRSLGAHDEPHGIAPSVFQSGRPPIRGEPEDLTRYDFVEDRLGALVRLGVERGVISMSRAGEILGIVISDMRELARTWVD